MRKFVILFTLILFTFLLNAQCFVKISSGEQHTVAIDDKGKLWGWGSNQSGELGIGNNLNQLAPVQIGTDSTWWKVDCGAYHTIALKKDSTLWTFGYNADGQLGTGNTVSANLPQPISGKYIEIGAGLYHSLAINKDSFLFGTGRNSGNQLGLTGTIRTFTQAPFPTKVFKVSGGSLHTIALGMIGQLVGVFASGNNSFGQLGNGTTNSTSSFVQVISPAVIPWVDIDASTYNSYILNSNGQLYSTGQNQQGQCGLNSVTATFTSPQLINIPSLIDFKAGYENVIAISNDSIYTWGVNNFQNVHPSSSVFISKPYAWGFVKPTLCSIGIFSTAVKSNIGSIYTWGKNDRGQLGNGSNSNNTTPNANQVLCNSIPTSIFLNANTEHVKVYPNPTSNLLNLEFSSVTAFEIYNIIGGKIADFNNKVNYSIDVSVYPNGLYFIKTENGNTKKFIKQ